MPGQRPFLARYRETRFLYLLISMSLLLLVHPILQQGQLGSATLKTFFTITLFSALYSISRDRALFRIGIILAIPLLGLLGSSLFSTDPRLEVFAFAIFVLFYFLTAIVIFRHVLEDERVTADKIYGALCVYLLVGLVWGCVYFVLESALPGSLAIGGLGGEETVQSDLLSRCIYYSYVTLTTLGYGDMTPVSGPARSFAFIEALTGQIYLAVLVARLVGLHIAHAVADRRRSGGGSSGE